jgi:hypothetical protein
VLNKAPQRNFTFTTQCASRWTFNRIYTFSRCTEPWTLKPASVFICIYTSRWMTVYVLVALNRLNCRLWGPPPTSSSSSSLSHSPALLSIVDIVFHYNLSIFLPVSGHSMPVSYYNYLQIQFNLIIPSFPWFYCCPVTSILATTNNFNILLSFTSFSMSTPS